MVGRCVRINPQTEPKGRLAKTATEIRMFKRLGGLLPDLIEGHRALNIFDPDALCDKVMRPCKTTAPDEQQSQQHPMG